MQHGAQFESPLYLFEEQRTRLVLIVEDEELLLALMEQILWRSGYRVLTARSALEALRLVSDAALEIDILVSDVMMPAMTGPVLAHLLVRQRPDLRILFVSGYLNQGVIPEGKLQEKLAFLQKPFTPAALIGALHGLLPSCNDTAPYT